MVKTGLNNKKIPEKEMYENRKVNSVTHITTTTTTTIQIKYKNTYISNTNKI